MPASFNYLTLQKYCEVEKNVLTLIAHEWELRPSHPYGFRGQVGGRYFETHPERRQKKNAEHILEALSNASDMIKWTDHGKIYQRVPLVVEDFSRSVGWNFFFKYQRV